MRAVFEVAHALAREGKRFEKPLEFDELYDLVVVIRPQFQRVPARTSAATATVRVGGAPLTLYPKVFDTFLYFVERRGEANP